MMQEKRDKNFTHPVDAHKKNFFNWLIQKDSYPPCEPFVCGAFYDIFLDSQNFNFYPLYFFLKKRGTFDYPNYTPVLAS
jgi:hypothetical protein